MLVGMMVASAQEAPELARTMLLGSPMAAAKAEQRSASSKVQPWLRLVLGGVVLAGVESVWGAAVPEPHQVLPTLAVVDAAPVDSSVPTTTMSTPDTCREVQRGADDHEVMLQSNTARPSGTNGHEATWHSSAAPLRYS